MTEEVFTFLLGLALTVVACLGVVLYLRPFSAFCRISAAPRSEPHFGRPSRTSPSSSYR